MIDSKKIVSFSVFQSHCDERFFLYAGRPGYFNVSCKKPNGPNRCNSGVCPIWNSDIVMDVPVETKSLREINLNLKQKLPNSKIASDNKRKIP